MRLIPNHPCYLISKTGRVWSTRPYRGNAGHWLRPTLTPDGYERVKLGGVQPHLIHRLVLETYVGPQPAGMEACHNDGNKRNNHLGNLRWDTRQSNIHDAIQHGTHNCIRLGDAHTCSKLREREVRAMRDFFHQGISVAFLSSLYACNYHTAWKAIHGPNWRWI